MTQTIKVLITDDHTLMRAGLRALIEEESDLEVVGEADSGEEAVAAVRASCPDVVLMDLDMPGCGGLEATRRIVALETDVRVLVLTARGEEECLIAALGAGASGYVSKHSAETDLLDAIRKVARGDVYLYPSATRLLVQGFRVVPSPNGDGHEDPLQSLSERESEVLRLTARGYTAAEIAERLEISPKTVDTYRHRFMEKLGLHHRSELVRFALQRGVLTAE